MPVSTKNRGTLWILIAIGTKFYLKQNVIHLDTVPMGLPGRTKAPETGSKMIRILPMAKNRIEYVCRQHAAET